MNERLLQTYVAIRAMLTERDDKGATAVEYGLLVTLIAVAIIVAVTTLGGNLSSMFDSVAGKVHS